MKKNFYNIEAKRRTNKGFTLVELIVVLVILAILAAITVLALLGYIDRAKEKKYILAAESVQNAIQCAYVESYGKGDEILQCRSDFRDNGTDHYSEKLFCYKAGAINSAYQCDENKAKAVIDTIVKLSDTGDCKLKYISFAYNHSTHQICDNKQRPGVAGQGADTCIVLNDNDNGKTVKLKFDDETRTWEIQK